MDIRESGEMYLENILVLSWKLPHVRSLDLAKAMDVSKPSVSRAVSILKNNSYIEVDSMGYLTLTPEGEAIAKKIYERHKVISSFFTGIGVEESVATSDACRIEHIISDESFEALKRFIEQNIE